MNTVCKFFSDLTLEELYHIWDIRDEVFWIEQNCNEKETDFKDQECYHLMIWDNDILVSYARILPPGLSYPETSIGRIATRITYRGKGIGKKLLQDAIYHAHQLYGNGPIKISAQLYLKKFYESFGFEQISEPYLEAGIMHIKMKMP